MCSSMCMFVSVCLWCMWVSCVCVCACVRERVTDWDRQMYLSVCTCVCVVWWQFKTTSHTIHLSVNICIQSCHQLLHLKYFSDTIRKSLIANYSLQEKLAVKHTYCMGMHTCAHTHASIVHTDTHSGACMHAHTTQHNACMNACMSSTNAHIQNCHTHTHTQRGHSIGIHTASQTHTDCTHARSCDQKWLHWAELACYNIVLLYYITYIVPETPHDSIQFWRFSHGGEYKPLR